MIPLGFFSFGPSIADMEFIASANGNNASTIVFNSIPQDYKHLQLVGLTRVTGTTSPGYGEFYALYNGASAQPSGQSQHSINGTNGGLTVTSRTNQTLQYIGRRNNANETNWGINSNNNDIIRTANIVTILNYSSNAMAKTSRYVNGVYGKNSGGDYVHFGSSLWSSTAPITNIELYANGGNWTTQTQFRLYGIAG